MISCITGLLRRNFLHKDAVSRGDCDWPQTDRDFLQAVIFENNGDASRTYRGSSEQGLCLALCKNGSGLVENQKTRFGNTFLQFP